VTFIGIAERLDQRLTSILTAELALGNLIYEAIDEGADTEEATASRREVGEHSGAREGCLRVLLLSPFKKRYKLPADVVFLEGELGTHDNRGPEYRVTSGTQIHVLAAPNG
jgi:hypothetical protein